MDNAVSIKTSDLQRATLTLLIDFYASQKAFNIALIEKLNLSEEDKEDLILMTNKLTLSYKDEILNQLYGSFGTTPEL